MRGAAQELPGHPTAAIPAAARGKMCNDSEGFCSCLWAASNQHHKCYLRFQVPCTSLMSHSAHSHNSRAVCTPALVFSIPFTWGEGSLADAALFLPPPAQPRRNQISPWHVGPRCSTQSIKQQLAAERLITVFFFLHSDRQRSIFTAP